MSALIIKNGEFETMVISNGSHWYGEEPDQIEELLRVLENYTLCPSFYVISATYYCDLVTDLEFLTDEATNAFKKYTYHFGGNFLKLSHAFGIYTNDKSVYKPLMEAVNKNINSNEFKQALKGYKERKELAHIEAINRAERNKSLSAYNRF